MFLLNISYPLANLLFDASFQQQDFTKTFQRPYWDLVVKVPNQRWADLGNPQQTDRLGEIIPEVVSRIAKYQSHKQQVGLKLNGKSIKSL